MLIRNKGTLVHLDAALSLFPRCPGGRTSGEQAVVRQDGAPRQASLEGSRDRGDQDSAGEVREGETAIHECSRLVFFQGLIPHASNRSGQKEVTN